MAEIQFQDVEREYGMADRCCLLGEVEVLNPHRPKHAVWIDNRTLAKWFYQANKEWAESFCKYAEKYSTKNDNETETIRGWKDNLKERLVDLRSRLVIAFRHDKEMLEAIAA